MKVRYGVIGCGAIGQRRHIPEIFANKDSVLVAICDKNGPRAEGVAAKFGDPQVFTDHRAMLKNAEIDAVAIGTPNYLHAGQTIDAFKAGKHVLVEKPMATSREDAKKMIAAGKKAKRFLMVGHNQRLIAGHIKAKELLVAGAIGKILSFRTAFKHGGPEGWCIENSPDCWFFRKSEAVLGVTGDLGVHKADLMRYLLGEDFAEVGGFLATLDKRVNGKLIQTDDNAYLTLKSKSGVIGSIIASWTNYGEPEANYTYIYGTEGVMMLAVDPVWNVIVRSNRSGKEERYKCGAVSTNEKQVSSGVSDAFTAAILTNKKPEIDGVEGYKALDVILTSMDAFKQKRTLPVKNAV